MYCNKGKRHIETGLGSCRQGGRPLHGFSRTGALREVRACVRHHDSGPKRGVAPARGLGYLRSPGAFSGKVPFRKNGRTRC